MPFELTYQISSFNRFREIVRLFFVHFKGMQNVIL